MSGIAVIYNLDGRPVDPAMLERMLASTAWRGPDGIGRWVDGPIAIGHAMLHTTAESTRERQPLREESLCLSFDGRIDNREDLAGAIQRAGLIIRTDTDAELILRAYQCWGADSPQKILGDFAYVIWDGHKRELFCARDQQGMKPFYYYHDGRVLLCGSELHQILEDPRVRCEPNEGMVAEHLSGGLASREETLFRGVMRLPPGHVLMVGPQRFTKRRYFDLDVTKQIRYRSDDDYAAHLRELVKEAVRCRMRSPGGVAAELSGGMDSSSVVGVAQKLIRDGQVTRLPFETFSMWFSHPDSDESRYINDVVAMWQLQSNRIEPVISGISAYAEQVLRYKDVPVYPSYVMMDSLKAMVGAKGYRACLSGQGGDEWQAGSHMQYADLLRSLRLTELSRKLRADAALAELEKYRPYDTTRFLLRYALWPLFPQWARQALRPALRHRPFPAWLEPEFARRSGLLERVRQQPQPPRRTTLAQLDRYQLFMKAGHVGPLELMERWASWFGFEARHPLNDLRIIEFTLATPEEIRRRGVLDKCVFRQAMRELVPDTILNRGDKGDFTHVFITTFEKLGGEKLFDSLAIASVGWVNADEVRKAYREMLLLYRNGDPHYARFTWSLFAVFGTELWFSSVFHDKQLHSAERPAAALVEAAM